MSPQKMDAQLGLWKSCHVFIFKQAEQQKKTNLSSSENSVSPSFQLLSPLPSGLGLIV